MAISQNFPNTPPSLLLDFAKSKKLDSRITFTRGSTGTYVDDNGLIRTAGINESRFDHDPNTLKSLGLLIEESRTNILLQSTTPDNLVSPWGKGLNTTRIGTTTAPDGTNTAVYYSGDGSGGNEFVNQQVNLAANTTYTVSVWAKLISGSVPTSGNIITVDYNNGSGPVRANFPFNGNLTTEWKRFSVTYTNVTAVSGYSQYFIADQNNTAQIAIWGAQLEAGAFPTSYIPTGASQVTRSADNASITGTNFSDWFNSNEGTIVSSWIMPTIPTSSVSFISSFSDGTVNNRFMHYKSEFGSHLVRTSADGSSANNGFDDILFNSLEKTAFSYETGTTITSYNGSSVNVVSQSIPTSINVLYLGGDPLGTPVSVTISQISYYPRRLSNTYLQELTK